MNVLRVWTCCGCECGCVAGVNVGVTGVNVGVLRVWRIQMGKVDVEVNVDVGGDVEVGVRM
jgi:hypothetical protein